MLIAARQYSEICIIDIKLIDILIFKNNNDRIIIIIFQISEQNKNAKTLKKKLF